MWSFALKQRRTSYLFSIPVIFHKTFTFHTTTGERRDLFLTLHYYFYSLYRHLDISGVINAESSPFYITNDWNLTARSWIPSASHQPRSYGLKKHVNSMKILQKAIMKKVMKDIFLKMMFNILKSYKSSIMIYHFYQKD